MKVFKLFSDEYFYAISALTPEQAKETLDDWASGINVLRHEEIPPEDWDELNIEMHEDNDAEKEPFFVSIRDLVSETDSEILFSNDPDFFDN